MKKRIENLLGYLLFLGMACLFVSIGVKTVELAYAGSGLILGSLTVNLIVRNLKTKKVK